MFDAILTKLGLKAPKVEPPLEPFALNTTLFNWSKFDTHTIEDSASGIFVAGATGSGKSSGPSKAIALAHLNAGFGGIFHAVKPTDTKDALEWCRQTGRLEDTIVFGPDQPWRFNFLDYELQRPGAGAGFTDNIVDTLLAVAELRDRKSPRGGGGGENAEFFNNAKQEILRASVDILAIGLNRVSIPDIQELILSAPHSPEQVRSERFRDGSFLFHCMREAHNKELTPFQSTNLHNTTNYWTKVFPKMSGNTRSGVTGTVSGIIDPFNRGLLRELFCTTTNFVPEQFRDGLVLAHGMSLMEFGEIGGTSQVVLKHATQHALLRHSVTAVTRPVFLHIDEFQALLTSYDSDFARLCRGFKVSFVLLTQNLPTIYSALGGGDKAEQEVDSLLGNLNVKIFCANSEANTNKWASETLGRTRQYMSNMNSGEGGDDVFGVLTGTGNSKSNVGMTETYEYEVQPVEFSKRLRTGGPKNNFEVDAIVFQNARNFKLNGRNWMVVTFDQK